VNIVIGLLFVSDKQPLVLLLFHCFLLSINKSTKKLLKIWWKFNCLFARCSPFLQLKETYLLLYNPRIKK